MRKALYTAHFVKKKSKPKKSSDIGIAMLGWFPIVWSHIPKKCQLVCQYINVSLVCVYVVCMSMENAVIGSRPQILQNKHEEGKLIKV